MDTQTFWQLIEESKRSASGDCMEQVRRLVAILAELPLPEIVEFHRFIVRLMNVSYTHDLWAAAYVINGGCSNDCFDYFRAWLIGKGEETFSRALQDPESLAEAGIDSEDPDVECQHMMYVAIFAYEEKTGKEWSGAHELSWILKEPAGEPWDEDAAYDKYPRLTAMFS